MAQVGRKPVLNRRRPHAQAVPGEVACKAGRFLIAERCGYARAGASFLVRGGLSAAPPRTQTSYEPPKIRVVDRPELMETFADAIVTFACDGGGAQLGVGRLLAGAASPEPPEVDR